MGPVATVLCLSYTDARVDRTRVFKKKGLENKGEWEGEQCNCAHRTDFTKRETALTATAAAASTVAVAAAVSTERCAVYVC